MSVNTASIREITERKNCGTRVTLLANFNGQGKAEFGIVEVESETDKFTISEIPLDQALDVFNHPFAYASRWLASGKSHS